MEPDDAAAFGDEVPPKLWVHVPVGEQRHCSGCFSLQKDKANEQPLWKKTGVHEAWLYQNKLGHWCIGGKEARLREFDWNRCFLYQTAPQDPHQRGAGPLLVASQPWQWWDSVGKKWVLDPTIRVLDVPHASSDQHQMLAQHQVAALRGAAEVNRRLEVKKPFEPSQMSLQCLSFEVWSSGGFRVQRLCFKVLMM
ncbi:unnamed protein product [Symbiodinium necroappetens]|uniref:Uncharacterized protein n=1 Tax=Symbiodinium necroappetens TaxID=1628268 RepID=A0A813AMZ7_9DINO|nr:unnamed protein product [Symbiodinium necroappetens]